MRPHPVLRCSLAMGLLVCGCGSNTQSRAPAATVAAEPATAGAPATPPVGRVVPVGNAPEGIVVAASGMAAVAVRNPDAIELVDAVSGAVRHTVPTSGAARHLGLGAPDGPVLVPLENSNQLWELTIDGRVAATVTGVGRQPHDASQTAGGTIVVTNEGGGGVVFVRGGSVVGELPPGPAQPGGVAAVGNYAAVADVRGSGVWVYDTSTRREVAHAPVGVKLTHAIALTDDLAAFADTDGGAVLLERVDPQLRPLAKIDAPGKPYGLAYDKTRKRIYVTLTASNLLRLIDVSNPSQPRILGDVPTVRQPNSVAVDPRSGNVLVTGSAPGGASGLQIVTPNELPQG